MKRTNGNGESIEVHWDAAAQVIREATASGTHSTFEYDATGRVVRAKNDSAEVTFSRDTYGRIVRETQGDFVVESVYDARGLRVKRNTPSGHECEWNWDADGQVKDLRLPGDELLEFVHDASGRQVERRMRGGLLLRQKFDSLDRLASQWVGLEAAPERSTVVDREYEYDLNGDPVEIRDKRWGREQFAYNPDGRIEHAERQQGPSERFEYDLVGNIALSTEAIAGERNQPAAKLKLRFYSAGGRLEKAGETVYLYDADGRVTEKREGERRWRYQWTVDGRLQSVQTPEGDRWRYEYDAFGRRIAKRGPEGTTNFVWDGSVIAEEVQHGTATAWVYEPGTFRPLMKQRAGEAYHVITDQVGTPRELVTANGKLGWAARLNTWGEEEIEVKKTDCPIRFQGQWFDQESGLHYNFHRYYDLETGQYLSPDPIGLEGGALTYSYVHNPLSWVDPLGLADCTPQQSPEWKVGPHGEMPTPRPPGYQSHHGVNSVWMEENVPGYNPAKAPAVLMKNDPYHNATRGVFNKFRSQIATRQGVGIADIDWSKVSPGSAWRLAEEQFEAARVPESVRAEYFRQFNIFLDSLRR